MHTIDTVQSYSKFYVRKQVCSYYFSERRLSITAMCQWLTRKQCFSNGWLSCCCMPSQLNQIPYERNVFVDGELPGGAATDW